MNILFISNKLYPEFEVYENKKLIVHIKIDDASRAFRIKFEDTRRVFLIADEVIRKTKIVTLLNEYSQQLGFLTKGNSSGSAGEIEIEGTQYTYGLNDAPPTE